MYKDLAHALESFQEKGFNHTFKLGNNCITCVQLDKEYSPDDLTILETHSFDKGTDPGSESTIYAIESNEGLKGTLIISYGMYVDPEKAKLVDQLLKSKK